MAKYLKPQTPLQHYNGDYIYPITSADQVLVSNGERLNANLINIDLNNGNNIPENVLKPQNPMIKGSDYFYPLTTSDQVIMPDGTRLNAENIGGMTMELLWENASPTSEFAKQDVFLDIKASDMIMIISLTSTTSIYEIDTIGAGNLFIHADGVKRSVDKYDRKLSFSDAYIGSNVNNAQFIPYKIFLIKGIPA